MIKTIRINEQPVEINSSMGWIYTFKEQFGYDVLPVILPAIEAGIDLIVKTASNISVDNVKNLKAQELMQAIDDDVLNDASMLLAGFQLTTITDIAWALAKNAHHDIPEPKEWLNSFEIFEADEIVPELFSAIVESSVSKKKAEQLLKKLKKAKTSPSQSTESPSQESTEG